MGLTGSECVTVNNRYGRAIGMTNIKDQRCRFAGGEAREVSFLPSSGR